MHWKETMPLGKSAIYRKGVEKFQFRQKGGIWGFT